MGVNVKEGFVPIYVIPREKAKQVRKLKDVLKGASELFLATDEDREGEAISWHLCEVLKPRVPVRRLVFHEITREAIQEALEHPREIDNDLVRAQETRRIIDRLYGYEVSPLLWRKIRPRLSAGRVQSVAVRLIVQRERERMAFVPATYWDLVATFVTAAGEQFDAALVSIDGRPVPSSRDFDPATGKLKDPGRLWLDETRRGRPPSGFALGLPSEGSGRPALYHPALSSFHHQHVAAGGQSQVRLYRPANHADCPRALRDRPHHLHAHRFDEPGGLRGADGAGVDRAAVWAGVSAWPADLLSDQSQECPRRTRRSGRRAGWNFPNRSARLSARMPSSSTT